MSEPRSIEYEGGIHVRPLGRGVMLDGWMDGMSLDDVIEEAATGHLWRFGWKGKCKIRIEIEADREYRPAEKEEEGA